VRATDHDAGILKVDQVLLLHLLEFGQYLVGRLFAFEAYND
jgi:hypothetical protein